MVNNKLRMYPNTIKDVWMRVARRLYRKVTHTSFLPPECVCDRQVANDLIFELLSKGEPCMIARFGTTELTCLTNYLSITRDVPYFQKLRDFVCGDMATPWWNTEHFNIMSLWSGIFPPCEETAVRFSQRYLQDIPMIDLLACHQHGECF